MTEKEECCKPRRNWWQALFGRRTIIAYAFTAAAVYGFTTSKIPADKFIPLVEIIIGFYFLSRKNGED